MKTEAKAEYGRLLKSLARTGPVSHGYVQNRGPGAGGPCYQWSRKEKGKTVSVALSREQFDAMRQAIANWREAQRTLKRMEQLTRETIFRSLPDTKRRKPLTKKILALS
jgi:hypothetical protein